MTFDDTLKIVVPIVVILSPLFKMFFTISSRLDKIEKQLELDKERIEESLERHDRHIHEIRNALNGIMLILARSGINHESEGR